MVIPNDKLKEILINDGLITAESFDEILAGAERMGHVMTDVLVSRGIITKNYLNELLVNYLGVGKAHLSPSTIDKEVLRLLPEDMAREKRLVAFKREDDGSIAVALSDPGNLEIIEFLKRNLKSEIKPYLASDEDINMVLSLYSKWGVEDFRKKIEENVAASLRLKALGTKEAAEELPIISIVDNLLAYAMFSRASDIHMEILENALLVRFRIDGMLREIIRLPKEAYTAVTARIKLLAGLKLDEHNRPQDGRFRQQFGTEYVDLRVSVFPTFFGEKVEMRLLAATQRPLSLEELGMLEDMSKILNDNIQKTFGMVLVSGPTGSGKTTTLYSILNILNKPDVNIVTVEDPIEYSIKYVNQAQVNAAAGITFANALRSILRQDPNIVLVGEIRDNETAEIAVNAALTGHLILSTVHTNNAATVIPRLVDMKVPSFLIAAVVNIALSQRLVGKICNDCIESYKPDNYLVELIKKQLSDMGIKSEGKIPKTFYRGKGCSNCGNIGLKGRIGLFEILDFKDEIRKYITDSNFSLDELESLARKNGMITMFEDGLRKVERGMTTIDEVIRVIRE